MKKLYAIHLTFVHVMIPHCACFLNMLFSHSVFDSQTKFWVIPSVGFGEAITQLRTAFCLQSLSAFKKETEYHAKTHYLSHAYVSVIQRHQPLGPMVLAKGETEKASFNGIIIFNVAQHLILLRHFKLWLKTYFCYPVSQWSVGCSSCYTARRL